MRVAIDQGPLRSGDSVRGIGTYTRELLKALGMKGVDIHKADLSKYNVVHITSFNPFFISVPFTKPKGTKFVLTIYDLIPLIYPDHYKPGIKGTIRFWINKFLINRNVDAIITISETSKKDICRFLGVSPDKVFVIYLASGPVFKKSETRKRYDLPERFALYVGDVNYNKNIPYLVKACAIAKMPLVIAGEQAKEIENENLDHSELKHLKNVDFSNVTRLGFVAKQDLVAIYNLASVYIQPSLYEGFGLPVLEAIACGCPVVASKIQAHVEIAEGAVTFFDPHDPKDIAKSLNNLLKKPKLPRSYSWEKTAKQTLEVYRNV